MNERKNKMLGILMAFVLVVALLPGADMVVRAEVDGEGNESSEVVVPEVNGTGEDTNDTISSNESLEAPTNASNDTVPSNETLEDLTNTSNDTEEGEESQGAGIRLGAPLRAPASIEPSLSITSDGKGTQRWVLRGDADRDFTITSADAEQIMQMSRNEVPKPEEETDKYLSADFDDNGEIDEEDASLVDQILEGSLTLPDTDSRSKALFEVEDIPEAGYYVSKITYNGTELELPEYDGDPITTTIDGREIEVEIDSSVNSWFVRGSYDVVNELAFEHAPYPPAISLDWGTDGRGKVIDWMLRGDVNLSKTVEKTDRQALLNYFNGLPDMFRSLENSLVIGYVDGASRGHCQYPVTAEELEASGGPTLSDAAAIRRLLNGAVTLPSLPPENFFDFRVIDQPNEGYYVSGVTINGSELEVPDKGNTSETPVGDVTYKVMVLENGNTVVMGYSLAENLVNFRHTENTDVNEDDIPDAKQVLIRYAAGENGSYEGEEYDAFTAENNATSIEDVSSSGRTAQPAEGHALTSWTNDRNNESNETGIFRFGTVETGTIITVTAGFEKQSFTIRFDPNGGKMNGSSDVVTLTHLYGEEFEIPEGPTKEGYTFTYWEGSEYYPGDTYRVEKDHTLVAQWKKNEEKKPTPTPPPTPDPTPAPAPTEVSPVTGTIQTVSAPAAVAQTAPVSSGDVPPTGDHSRAWMWMGLMVIAAALSAAMAVRKRHRG